MILLPTILAVVALLLPLVAGLLAGRLPAGTAGRLTTIAAGGAFATAVLAAVTWLAAGSPAPLDLRGSGGMLPLLVRIDTVSLVMMVLVCWIGLAVLRFSRSYLAGDPRQAAFLGRMALTLAAVLALALAANLLVLAGAWVAMSLLLHGLLLHRPGRAGAVFSARKKFLFSRLAELCLLVALVWIHRHYGTWNLAELFSAAEAGDVAPLPGVGFLLAACAALKSAQFPFHSWLPDTMETPTPVSAFMHAGIINAGGFLIIRLQALLVHAPGALVALALVGAVTAGVGATVMLAQPGVKRSLAWSTIAQMGFMLLQCGLGAFGLALLHLVAHSLYKAHAFLHSGSTIGAPSRAAIPLGRPALAIGALGGLLAVTATATLASVLLPRPEHGMIVFTLVTCLALTYGVARSWAAAGPRLLAPALLAALGIAGVTLLLHSAARNLPGFLVGPPPPVAVLAAIGLLFTTLFLLQVMVWRLGRHPLGQRLYVHALNGFYVGTIANRLLDRFWPRRNPLTSLLS